jgi:hypothetical protein
MKYPARVRTHDAEVKTWTENISGSALMDIAAALRRRIKVDRSHDIPYIAGYSRDGATIFIDRHMPHSLVYRAKRVDTDRFLLVHEIVEKALLDQLGLHYLHAHQIALRIEQAAVRAAGIEWQVYNRFTKSKEKKIGDERLTKVPRDLDLTPYQDEHDFATLRAMTVARR